MKNILIFSLTYHPFIGGAEVAVKEITERLTDFSYDLITVNLDGKQKAQEKMGNVNVYRIGKGKMSKYWFPFSAKAFAEKLNHKKPYDAMWAIMANQAGLAALFFKKKNPKIPFLLTLQEGDSEFDIWLKTFCIRPLYKNIYKSADYIQAISHFLKKRAVNLGAKCPVEVIPNGVNISIREEESNPKVQERGEKIIITASRLEKKNGIDILIKSVKELLVSGYLPRLVSSQGGPASPHVGRVTLKILGTGSMEERLKYLVKELHLENVVEFLGQVNPEKVYDYLRDADIFVRPSRSEGLGNAFLEAMSMGVPVIGTPVGGIPDFLIDRETGLFCKVDDPKDLSEKIALLLNNKELYENVRENGRKMVVERYQWNGIAQRMKNIFESII